MTTVRVAVSLTWQDSFDQTTREAVVDRVAARRSAGLQGPGPSLVRVLDEVARAGAERVELVGWSSTDGPVPLSWLRRVAGAWVRDHREGPEVLVRAGVLRPGDECGDQWRVVSGSEAPLTNPQWQEMPPFRHHLLICRGPRCNAAGAESLHAQLLAGLQDAGALDTEVLVTVTGCMFPCNHAPLVTVWPDGRCFRLTEATLGTIIADLTG